MPVLSSTARRKAVLALATDWMPQHTGDLIFAVPWVQLYK
jgi:hypothetical protein